MPINHRGRGNGNPDVVRPVRTLETEDNVIECVEENPEISTREIARQLNISRMTAWRILKQNRYHPYHYRKVHHIQEPDKPARIEFCQWMLQKIRNNRDFLKFILFSDESLFKRGNHFNLHNNHHWATENPHNVVTTNHQHRFTVNIWCGIIGNKIIGPVIFPNRLNSYRYMEFIRDELPNLINNKIERENVPLVWYQHDGATVHTAVRVINCLEQQFPDRFIGAGGVINWPARSPDLNPLDYFLWGTVKDIVYRDEIHNLDELEEKIFTVIDNINPEDLEAAITSLERRLQLCLDCDGGHFEQLL